MDKILDQMLVANSIKNKNYRMLRLLEQKVNNFDESVLFCTKNELERKLAFRCLIDIRLTDYIKNKALLIINYK